MNKPHYSPEYIDHRKRGPFPGRIDPWSEAARYFHAIHGVMISNLLVQIQDPLDELGYVAGVETSLQVAENRRPDLFVERAEKPSAPIISWDYDTAAVGIHAQPGLVVDWEVDELQALKIKDSESGDLITIVELISPGNKTDLWAVVDYQERRSRLIRMGVNVMELDLTRSFKHLLDEKIVATYAYHAAVYLPAQLPRIIGVDFAHALERLALPLRGEVIPIEVQAAYQGAYQSGRIATHIHNENRYEERFLPFPSLLTADERTNALQAVETWKAELERLKNV